MGGFAKCRQREREREREGHLECIPVRSFQGGIDVFFIEGDVELCAEDLGAKRGGQAILAQTSRVPDPSPPPTTITWGAWHLGMLRYRLSLNPCQQGSMPQKHLWVLVSIQVSEQARWQSWTMQASPNIHWRWMKNIISIFILKLISNYFYSSSLIIMFKRFYIWSNVQLRCEHEVFYSIHGKHKLMGARAALFLQVQLYRIINFGQVLNNRKKSAILMQTMQSFPLQLGKNKCSVLQSPWQDY